jgi:HEPN domain-containing protein
MDKQSCIVDFATRSFRDVADRDYICARACYRLDLDQQFLWAAQQAIEKYLKGILLFNNKETKKYGHSLKKARDALAIIGDISFEIPPEVDKFIEYLDDQGNNRYFTAPFHKDGHAIFRLDQTVWCLRRYCQNLRLKTGLQQQLKVIHSAEFVSAPNKLRIWSGDLEKLIDGKSNRARQDLLWCNQYFGKRRNLSKPKTVRSSSGWPTHSCSPECFLMLRDLVKFETDVIKHFDQFQCSPSATPAPAASQKSPA